MNGVLDASMVLAWQFQRTDAAEAALAERALGIRPRLPGRFRQSGMRRLLFRCCVASARELFNPRKPNFSWIKSPRAQIETDSESPRAHQANVLGLARTHHLTAYDASYLELALRTGGVLATFDRKLAEAVRKAGGQVFGDRA